MAGVLRFMGGIGLALATAGCVSVRPQDPVVVLPPLQPAVQASSVGPMLSPAQAAQNFAAVVARVEPVAEAICHERARGAPCDLQIVIDDRIDQPPNAYQTLDKFGQPIVAFTVALIADARNADELAFVMGHEASHHIAGHIPRQQENGMRGALLAGILASVSGRMQRPPNSCKASGPRFRRAAIPKAMSWRPMPWGPRLPCARAMTRCLARVFSTGYLTPAMSFWAVTRPMPNVRRRCGPSSRRCADAALGAMI